MSFQRKRADIENNIENNELKKGMQGQSNTSKRIYVRVEEVRIWIQNQGWENFKKNNKNKMDSLLSRTLSKT